MGKGCLKIKTWFDLLFYISLHMIEAFVRGNRVIYKGNVGSHVDVQHLLVELVSRFELDRSA